MKTKITFFICLSLSLVLYSQSAPWLYSPYLQTDDTTYEQIVEAGNQYFLGKDINAKGSGYKQFMRWQRFARNYVKPNGYLMTDDQINAMRNSFITESNLRMSNANWQSLGPFDFEDTQNRMSGQGRVNTITVSPHDANEYWIGTPGGGAWQSLDAGLTWSPKTDNMPNLGVSAIAIDPINPLVVYAGTGDDEGSTFSGRDGIYKSTDGGNNWAKLSAGGTNNSFVCDIYINPSNNQQIYAASGSGFLKSDDGGVTWTTTINGFSQNLKVKPGDWSTVYYNTRDEFYVSTDSGDSWTQTTTGLPTTAIQRIMIDVTPDEPNNVYAVIADVGSSFHGIYKSIDSGVSFTKTDNSANNLMESSQAFFDLDIAVDPSDADNIFTGCLNIWKSSDQGVDFARVNEWDKDYQPTYTHADIHQIRYFNGSIFVASDGGIYRSDDDGASFIDLTKGLAISEVYEINTSPIDTDHIVAGFQDNGGYAYDGNVWRNWHWSDGTSNAIDPTNPNIMHSFFQTGAAYFRTEDSGQTTRDLFGVSFGNFVTPMSVNSQGDVFAATLFYWSKVNDSWVSGFQFPSRVFEMEIAPSDDNVIYANTGVELFRSDNGGTSFNSINTSISGFIEGISINKTDSDIVYIITSNISSGGIYKSIDGGQNFININSNLAGNLPLRVLEIQPNHPDNPLYLGTDFGVYRYDDITGQWDLFQTGMPNAIVRDLSIDVTGKEMTAGTYGRGIWKTYLPQNVFSNDLNFISISKPSNQIGLFPFTPEANVENSGQNNITNITIDYDVNTVSNSTNSSSTLVPNTSEIISLNEISSRGFYKISANALVTLDNQLSNNNKQVSMTLNDFGEIGIVNSFETSEDELIAVNSSETGSVWEKGMPSGTLLNSASTGSQVYGTNLSGFYDSYTRSYLYTQFYNLSNAVNPELSFDMAYDIATGHSLYIQYSLDNGASWQLLGSASDSNWYNSSEEQWQGLSTAWQGGQWSGATNTMITNYTYDLSPWIGESSFLMRFVFDAKFNDNVSTAKEGVVLDNLVINGSTLSVNLEKDITDIDIFPNPSNDIITIRNNVSEAYKAEIFDILGNRIKTLNIQTLDYKLDVRYFETGIYLIRFNIKGSVFTKKIVVY